MTPAWAELHELEPGLRPDNGLVLEHGGWTLNPYYKEAGIDDEIAYSLCRDRALLWLAKDKFLHPKVLCNAPPWATSPIDPVWEVGVYLPDDPDADEDTGYVLYGGDTYDEALRAACAAVIAAK